MKLNWVNYRAIWGTEANDMDPDIKHMVVHLQVALARFPGLEKNPCISTTPVFKEISQKELQQALWAQPKCEHTLSFWKEPRVPNSLMKAS